MFHSDLTLSNSLRNDYVSSDRIIVPGKLSYGDFSSETRELKHDFRVILNSLESLSLRYSSEFEPVLD